MQLFALLCNKAEAFEHRTITKPLSVADQNVVLAVVMREIGDDAVSNVLNPATCRGVVETVYDRTVNIRDQNLRATAPNRLRAEELSRMHVAYSKAMNPRLQYFRSHGKFCIA